MLFLFIIIIFHFNIFYLNNMNIERKQTVMTRETWYHFDYKYDMPKWNDYNPRHIGYRGLILSSIYHES